MAIYKFTLEDAKDFLKEYHSSMRVEGFIYVPRDMEEASDKIIQQEIKNRSNGK